MPRPRSRRPASAARQLAGIGVAAPQVAAHRLRRMVLAGPVLSAGDRREFTGMVVEKQLAFAQSWMAMSLEALRWQQRLVVALLAAGTSPFAWPWRHAPLALERIAAHGLAPVSRKAAANARRLARSRKAIR